jgi:predicted Zn-dependent protease
MRTLFRALLPLLVALPAVSACAVGVNPVTGAKRAYAYSWQQEIELGRRADRDIVEQLGVVDDPALAAYVERIGEAVLATSHLRRQGALEEYRQTRFTFRVLDTEVVNAFALPGGYVYVTRGLLAHLDNEAQLAVVLGHEVAHVAARHSSKDAFKSAVVVAGLAGAEALGDELGGVAELVADAGGLGAGLLMTRHSRDDERESDRLGVEYAVLAGYDAAEGAHFFAALERMSARESWFPSFLSTHPDPGRREETVRALAAQMAAQVPGERRVERDAYLQRIEGLALGGDPRQGYVEENVFYHPAGGFHFPVPRGWQMAREGREVEFAPARGAVSVLFRPSSQHATAAAAAADFVAEAELGDVSASTPVLPGHRASRVDATATDDEGTFRLAGLWVEREGAVLRFLGVAAPDARRTMNFALSTMAEGIRPLTDPHYVNVYPALLEVVTVTDAAPFREIVGERMLPEGMELEELAIMNGVGVDEVVEVGAAVKLPR